MPQIALNCEHQQQSNWCWAAVVASVNNYYAAKFGKRPPITQQQLANQYVGGRNEQFDPFTALKDLQLNNGDDRGIIDWKALTETVDEGEPNIAKVGRDGSGHYILVIGYEPGTARTRRYIIIDPDEAMPAPRALSEVQLQGYGNGYVGTLYTKDHKAVPNQATEHGQHATSTH